MLSNDELAERIGRAKMDLHLEAMALIAEIDKTMAQIQTMIQNGDKVEDRCHAIISAEFETISQDIRRRVDMVCHDIKVVNGINGKGV